MHQPLLPPLLLGEAERARLTALANATVDKQPDLADELLFELERAAVVADTALPDNVVRMGSRVTYRAGAEDRRVTLVYPGEANIESGRISILTPVGGALIGLKEGQSIDWKTRDGRTHRLTIMKVEQAAAEG